jgi:hypothetical protein
MRRLRIRDWSRGVADSDGCLTCPVVESWEVGRWTMATLEELEQRLIAVEKAIAELRQQTATPASESWLDRIAGKFENDPEFEKVIQYGREFRESHPYPEDGSR